MAQPVSLSLLNGDPLFVGWISLWIMDGTWISAIESGRQDKGRKNKRDAESLADSPGMGWWKIRVAVFPFFPVFLKKKRKTHKKEPLTNHYLCFYSEIERIRRGCCWSSLPSALSRGETRNGWLSFYWRSKRRNCDAKQIKRKKKRNHNHKTVFLICWQTSI